MPDTSQIAQWATSGEGRLVAAAALFILVWVLKTNKLVRERLLTTAARKRASVVVLAAVPAVALALTTNSATADIAATLLTAIFGAMGLHGAIDIPKG